MESGFSDSRLNGERRKILVIEDEMVNRLILGNTLRGTYDVVFAETGAQALEILNEQFRTLSLVLLDLNLPDMYGVDILHRIKADAVTAVLPFIVMTADQDAEVQCLNLGATDFIAKPYPKPEVILARILRTIELFEGRDILRWTERDQLTGLYNPEFFFRYAAQFDARHPDIPTDAILLDVNRFHMLNERYGRAFGDEALRRIADNLRQALQGAGGIVCRKSADTFLAYCPHRSDYGDLLRLIGDGIDKDYHARVRMGVYPNADRAIDMERRFARAKQAADRVKTSFSGAAGVYDAALYDKESFNEQLLEDFAAAIRGEQFTAYYQPKFDIRTEAPALCSAEALVRWNHPRLGMVSPGIFIPLFEENGLIRELDSYMWRKTAGQIRSWKDRFGWKIPVSVNVSRIDLSDPLLPQLLEKVVDEAGIAHEDFLLEITESAYTEDAEQIVSVAETLRESGFRIEMDDFGTGYSSLNMITALPIDTLKLDMQFVRTAFRDRNGMRLIEAVLSLARSLGLTTVAEGVETEEQLQALKALSCDIVQGYYFSKPLPAEEFEAFVREKGI
ncbi:MAG: EAL domain-containing protein [Oscillospiraceae bacterium]|nr:EAL domain-containing protein [Oscillospiraceae bacterium]